MMKVAGLLPRGALTGKEYMVPQLTMGPAKTKTTQASPKMAKLAVWSESGCQGGSDWPGVGFSDPNATNTVVAGVRVLKILTPGQTSSGPLNSPWGPSLPASAQGPSVPTSSASGPLHAVSRDGRARAFSVLAASPNPVRREVGVTAPRVKRPGADFPAGRVRRDSTRRATALFPSSKPPGSQRPHLFLPRAPTAAAPPCRGLPWALLTLPRS